MNCTQWWVLTLADSRACEYFLTLQAQKYSCHAFHYKSWGIVWWSGAKLFDVGHSSASPWCSQSRMSNYERKRGKKTMMRVQWTALAFKSEGCPGGLRPLFEKAGNLVLKLAVTDQFTNPSWDILIALHTCVELTGNIFFLFFFISSH